ncbi:hypothetical protein MKZ02_06530 [Pseudobacillus sp. FSL P4-0506]|uniref:hypothetical protein n=1 Tax=Pseudobacillus sp. FSL P4-0506 TaxID=2921576 RepID=UPI0030F7DD9C
MFYLILFIVISICLMTFIFLKKIFIKTSTPAIVMALGIIIRGVLSHMAGSHSFLVQLLSAVIIALWLTFSFSIILSFIYKRFIPLHIVDPLNRFGIGTWIAGTSICAILIFEQFSYWQWATWLLLYISIFLWPYYLWQASRSFYELRGSQKVNIHGILLLTTVSTQSLVLLLNEIYREIPSLFNWTLLIIGIVFYAVGTFLIIRHLFTAGWNMKEHWANTNCILHGALSITGFAGISSGAINGGSAVLWWIFVSIVFLFVEFLEICRLVQRLRYDGVKKGIWTYHVTQWSRLFTFGMFYTFTSLVKPQTNWLVNAKTAILTAGAPLIFALFIIELLLYSSFLLQILKQPQGQRL